MQATMQSQTTREEIARMQDKKQEAKIESKMRKLAKRDEALVQLNGR